MARELHSRLRISGTLTAQTPLHVGGHGDSPDTDLPLAQNGRGDFYIPGTSVTGVLRAWCQKNFGAVEIPHKRLLVDELFGFQKDDDGQASFVIVDDIALSEDLQSEIRDGVGIDRYYGAAADQAKFDRAALPRGTTLPLEITVEIEKSRKIKEPGKKEPRAEKDSERETRIAQTKALFGQLLTAMQTATLRFGAARTRGLGRLKLTSLKEIREQRFDDILSWLNSQAQLREFTELAKIESEISSKLHPTELPSPASEILELEIEWTPRLRLMVKAGYDGVGVDMLPLTSAVESGKVALVLPGSSIKGVLRSHGERIMRTLLPKHQSGGKKFHDQIDGISLVEEVFGARKKEDKNAGAKGLESGPKLGLGALAVDDCYTKEPMDADQWRKIEGARDALSKQQGDDTHSKENGKPRPKENGGKDQETGDVSYFKRELWRYLREIDEQNSGLSDEQYKQDTHRFKLEHHVAIDRWTGGAAEGALYSVLAPAKVNWEPMRLTLDFGRIKDESRLPSLMLLLLILRDVATNRLPFGFATNRGMGEIEVKELRLRGRNFEADLSCPNRPDEQWVRLSNGRVAELDAVLRNKLDEEWKQWLAKNRK